MKQIFVEPAYVVDDVWGQYIPQRFAENFFVGPKGWASGLSSDDLAVLLAGPGQEDYWDVWDDVVREGVTGPDGVEYSIHEDGGISLIPPGWDWSDEKGWYVPAQCEDCSHFEECSADDPDCEEYKEEGNEEEEFQED